MGPSMGYQGRAATNRRLAPDCARQHFDRSRDHPCRNKRPQIRTFSPPPPGATAALVLADGSVLWGKGLGATGSAVGEVVFNTAMTGYQEALTDPSFAGQIITFTFPHIGNVGANNEDIESTTPSVRGAVLRADVTTPSNWRATRNLDAWMKSNGIVGISGVDTRALTRRIRDSGAPNGTIVHAPDGVFDLDALLGQAQSWPGLLGMDLAKDVTCGQTYSWDETLWQLGARIWPPGSSPLSCGGRRLRR